MSQIFAFIFPDWTHCILVRGADEGELNVLDTVLDLMSTTPGGERSTEITVKTELLQPLCKRENPVLCARDQ